MVTTRSWGGRWIAVCAVAALVAASSLIGAPAASAATSPANSEAPTVSGSASVGSTLSATAGRWSGDPQPTYGFRWQYQTAQGTWPDIAGATSATYVVQTSDVSHVLRIDVTASNSAGSAGQVSVGTAAATQAPASPQTPPAPPNDVLGTPNNSRSVSADILQISHMTDGDGSGLAARSSTIAAATSSTGDLGTPDFSGNGTNEDHIGQSLFPAAPTTRGRFGDQNSDGVLTAYYATRGSGSSYVVVNPNSETARLTPNDFITNNDSVPVGQWIMLRGRFQYPAGSFGYDVSLDATGTNVTAPDYNGNPITTNTLALDSTNGNGQYDQGSEAWWYVMPDPGGSSYVQLSNRVTGTCLTEIQTAQTGGTVTTRPCSNATGTVLATQLWSIRGGADQFAIQSKATGQYLSYFNDKNNVHINNGVTQMVDSAPDSPWSVFTGQNVVGPQGATGGSVPTWTFPDPVLTGKSPTAPLLSSGDLDRIPDSADHYHDEAVAVYPLAASGQTLLTVLDYATPLHRVTATSLPLTQANFARALGVTVGDFDGDGLNEIAFVWQDTAGNARITFYTYRAGPSGTRTLASAGSGDLTVPKFTVGDHVTVRAADFDGDMRDDLAIATTSATPLTVLSFTSSFSIRGSASTVFNSAPFATSALRGISMEPGLFHFDPDAGYSLNRRQLALAWTEQPPGQTTNTYVAVFSVEPDPSCSANSCALTIDAQTPNTLVQPWLNGTYPAATMPLSMAVGGFSGRPSNGSIPTWGIALSINDSAMHTRQSPYVYMLGVTNRSVTVLSKHALPTEGAFPDGSYPDDYYPVTATDFTGASLMFGAPLILHVDNLLTPSLIAAAAPGHSDWFPQLNDNKGGFYNVSRYPNFSVTLGSSGTKQYDHTTTTKDGWNIGVSGSVDVKGTAKEGVPIAEATESLDVKVSAGYVHQFTESTLHSYSTSFSTAVSQRSDDDDLVQGQFQSYTVYRYPLLGGPLANNDGTPYTDPACKGACYGFYEATVPGAIDPLNTGGRTVPGYSPTWENGNALSYPQLNTAAGQPVPTPDIGPYSYKDDQGNPQQITVPLFNQEFGVGGTESTVNYQISSSTGTDHTSESDHSWNASTQITGLASWTYGIGDNNLSGSVKVKVGVKGGQDFASADGGQNISSTGSSFSMDVPAIDDNKSYQMGTAYYYDTAGTARVSMADDVTDQSAWWRENYSTPDPALSLPNATFTSTDNYNNRVLVSFDTAADAQQIRGFSAVHPLDPSNPSTPNAPYTDNPVVGDPVQFNVAIHNYSLNPVNNVPVSFYAVPVGVDANGNESPVGDPQPIGSTTVTTIPALGMRTAQTPAWTAKTLPGDTAVRDWRIFTVIDPKGTIANDTHPWKNAGLPCPTSSLDPSLPKGTVINGVMVDPMTGKASTLACAQNNQGWGAVSVSPASPAARTSATRVGALDPQRVVDLAATTTPKTSGVTLNGAGAVTGDRSHLIMSAGEIASVKLGQQFTVVAYVGAQTDSVEHQPVLVYDGPPSAGHMLGITTLDGVTAAEGNQARFNWRPTTVGLHHICLELLGTDLAGPGGQTCMLVNVTGLAAKPPPPSQSTGPSHPKPPPPSQPGPPAATSSAKPAAAGAMPTDGGGGNLADTGVPLALLIVFGVALIVSGAVLASRRRAGHESSLE